MFEWVSRAVQSVLFGLAATEFAVRRSLPVDGFHVTERYGSVVECGGRSYMATRLLPLTAVSQGAAETRSMFHTAIRVEGERTGLVHQVDRHRMGHNLALSCEHGRLYAYGGTDSRNPLHAFLGSHNGIYRAEVSLDDGALLNAVRVVNGSHPGCVERRVAFGGTCEFDGKLSAVRHRGRTLLFARANTVATGGGRHVQRTVHDGTRWTSFELLDIDGVESGVADNNVYFFVADPWNATHIVASFPAVLQDGRSGVFVSYSEEGTKWSAPQLVAAGKAFGQRVELFPVGVRKDRVLVMHVNLLNSAAGEAHDVQLWSYGIRGGPREREHSFDVDRLRLVN